MDRTYVLPGTGKRLRIALVENRVEQTTWTRAGARTTTKNCDDAYRARVHYARTVAKKLHDGYVYLAEPARPGELILEASCGDALDLSPDGKRLAIARGGGTSFAIEIVEVDTGSRHVAHEESVDRIGRVAALCFDRNVVHVAYQRHDPADFGHRIARIDLATGTSRVVAHGELRGCDVDRRRVLASDDKGVRVVENGTVIFEHAAPLVDPHTAAISPSGRLVAVHAGHRHGIFHAGEHTRNEIQLLDVDAGVAWESVALPFLSRVRAIGVAPGDTEIVVAWQEGHGPVALAIPSGEERWSLDVVPKDWRCSPEGAIAVATALGACIYDRERRAIVDVRLGYVPHSMAFSRDGTRVAIGAGQVASVYALAGPA